MSSPQRSELISLSNSGLNRAKTERNDRAVWQNSLCSTLFHVLVPGGNERPQWPVPLCWLVFVCRIAAFEGGTVNPSAVGSSYSAVGQKQGCRFF